jgi:hypothetical protein
MITNTVNVYKKGLISPLKSANQINNRESQCTVFDPILLFFVHRINLKRGFCIELQSECYARAASATCFKSQHAEMLSSRSKCPLLSRASGAGLTIFSIPNCPVIICLRDCRIKK